MALPERPGNLVFGRRRLLKALAPADGVLGTPAVLCRAIFTAVLVPTIVVNPIDLLRGPNFPKSETILNPTVVLTSS